MKWLSWQASSQPSRSGGKQLEPHVTGSYHTSYKQDAQHGDSDNPNVLSEDMCREEKRRASSHANCGEDDQMGD